MKKVGIMTFWESNDNYGQLLQSYALQTYIKQLGHDVFLIKYQPIKNVSKTKIIIGYLRHPYSRIRDRIKVKKIVKARNKAASPRKFNDFRDKYITFSNRTFHSWMELRSNPPDADIYICGSDQVWNVPHLLNEYLLDFGANSVQRIAYAASFGKTILTSAERNIFSSLLPHFRAISVREKTGVDLINGIGFTDVKWVPDPTLLLNTQKWLNIQVQPSKIFDKQKKKIFLYTLGNKTIDLKQSVFNFFNKMPDTEIIHVSSQGDFTGTVYPTINEWLYYINNCDFFITNSFHGMIFSIIFNKNFVVLPCTGLDEGMNDRIISFLDRLNIRNRILNDSKEIMFLYQKEIDWITVVSKLNIWINETKIWLQENIN